MKPLVFFSTITLSLVLAQGAYAQDNDDDSDDDDRRQRVVEVDENMEEVVVTGSRIRRDEYSTASPIQVIDGTTSRDLGLIDTTEMLQGVSQAAGANIDNSYNGFVLDNGPGASQLNLRGLGPQRVLTMVNSRRQIAAGAGGAPTSADLSIIPSIMIDHVEFLLEGASSVYGSDAVAGVANIIMRKDFEGLEFEASGIVPESGAGTQQTVGLMWGSTGEQWSFGVAGEYFSRGAVKLADREFSDRCNRFIYETEHGQTVSLDRSRPPGVTPSPCKSSIVNMLIGIPNVGRVWFTPGETNVGIPNFSGTHVSLALVDASPDVNAVDVNDDGVPDFAVIDPDGDGLVDVDLLSGEWNIESNRKVRERGDLYSDTARYNIYAYGDYDLRTESNIQFYAEMMFSGRDTHQIARGGQFFPWVPGTNPYNPCNQNQPNGVNCRSLFPGVPSPNYRVLPVLRILGDRDEAETSLQQSTYVGGVRGDFPFLQGDGGFGNWSYDAYYSYSVADGSDVRYGILEEEIEHSLANSKFDANGNVVCDPLPSGKACVPVNMFAESLYRPGGGSFATQAEFDYLIGERRVDTKVEQTIGSVIIQGDIGLLPWNDTPIPLVLGYEWREDSIDSVPNDVAGDGLFWGYFSDGGAKGSRTLGEFFLETEVIMLAGLPYAEEWSLNVAGRFTDESTFGSHTTYSVKMLYAPNDILTLRGTYGTSFRAPNAREQFLSGTSGFWSVFDPCMVPPAARERSLDPSQPPTYNADEDEREQIVLDNCEADGVDPFTLGLSPATDHGTTYSVEALQKGGEHVQTTLDPETSDSYTYGAVLDVPFFEGLDMRFSATLFDIRVEQTISELTPGFVVTDCYVEVANYESGYCPLIERDSETQKIEVVNYSYININSVVARGIDYNAFFETNFIVNDRNLSVQLDVRATRLLSNEFIFEESETEEANTPIAAAWTGNVSLFLAYNDLRFNWRSNYISGETDTQYSYDDYSPCRFTGVLCRPKIDTQPYWLHRVTVSWSPRDWSFAVGVINLFDVEPPLVDTSAPHTQLNNVPLGVGYDLLGRRAFASVRKSFQ